MDAETIEKYPFLKNPIKVRGQFDVIGTYDGNLVLLPAQGRYRFPLIAKSINDDATELAINEANMILYESGYEGLCELTKEDLGFYYIHDESEKTNGEKW